MASEEDAIGAENALLGDGGETYNAAGGKDTYHGNTYQLRLLTLCMLRGIGNYSFTLATDMKEADKFDDVVFRYTDQSTNKHVYRFLQAKHRKIPESSNVTFQALMSKSKNTDFSLAVYYRSYRKIKNIFVGEDKEIRDVIICTNANFKRKDSFKLDQLQLKLNDMLEFTTKDDLLGTELQCFRKEFEGKKKLVNEIIHNVCEMIKKETKDKGSEGEEEKEVASDIESYMEKLRFAMNQPGVEGLKKEIIDELKNEHAIAEAKTAFSFLEQEMNEWMSKPEGTYLTFMDGKKAVQRLQKMFGSISFHRKDPVKFFTGRQGHLEILKQAHTTGEEVVVISGLGGVGKSQLAKKFIHDNSDSFDSFVWMRAETSESLTSSFLELAKDKMNIKTDMENGKVRDIRMILDDVYQYFSRRRCVIVFDNVEKMEEDDDYIEMFMPSSSPKPFLLLTSRYQSWGSLKVVTLDLLTEIEAVELIKTSLGLKIPSEEALVKSLAKTLQYFPLALQQAIAYIKKTVKQAKYFGGESGIRCYLDDFKKSCKTLLHQKLETYSGHSYQYTTAITWDITLKVILENYPYGHHTQKILQVIAYFSPDKIPMADIKNCLQEVNEEDFNASLILLHEYSMLSLECKEVTVHRLVQMVTRQKTKDKGEEELLLDSLLDSSFKLETQNSISIWEHCCECGYEDLVKKHATLPKQIIRKLKEKSSLQGAYLFGKKHLEKMNELIGQTDERVIDAMYALAGVTHELSKYDEAYKLYGEVFEAQKLIFGEDHEKLTETMNGMAVVLHDQGLYDAALRIFNRVLNKWKRSLGESHYNTLILLNNIGTVLSSQGKFDEALAIYEEIIEGKISQLGENHASVFATRRNMTAILELQGKREKALEILEDVYKKELPILGEKHRDTMMTKYKIACLLQSTGKNQKALEMLQDLYKMQKNILGECHHDTLNTLQNKATLFQALAKHSEALMIFDEVYEKLKETLGEAHPDTLTAGQNKAISLHAQGRLDESLKMYREVYNKMQRHLGRDHNTTLVTGNNIAKVLQDQNHYEDALMMYHEVYERQKALLGENSLNTLITRQNIASLLQLQGKYDEASEIFDQVYEVMKIEFGEDSIDTNIVRHNMAGLLQSRGKHEEALIVFNKVYEKQKIILGIDNPNTLRTMKNIGCLLMEKEKYENAAEVFQDIIKIEAQLQGQEDPRMLTNTKNLVFCLWKMGKLDEVIATHEGKPE